MTKTAYTADLSIQPTSAVFWEFLEFLPGALADLFAQILKKSALSAVYYIKWLQSYFREILPGASVDLPLRAVVLCSANMIARTWPKKNRREKVPKTKYENHQVIYRHRNGLTVKCA